ncbi:MAG: RNA polymerase sigma factor [Deltaproteobacteria bacterium]|nr:RNA polymerase sigma factor [Deltaproteobacteria bacterium]
MANSSKPSDREPRVLGRAAPWGNVADEELVQRALEGDRWAEEVLFRRHAPEVAATAARLLGNRADAEDVVQDTFVAALDELSRLRDPRAVRAWLLRIAIRKVHRRFRRRRILRALGLDRGAGDGLLESLAADEVGAEGKAELALLDRRLAALPLALRTAWMLRHVDGRALGEIAVACDCSLATVKRRIARAQEAIGIQLDGGGADE